jgi:hypothetical protein
MPDATITSTASTFGTISGTFAADQSTVTGTISGTVTGTLTGSVGVPGPAGPGVPAGGTAGQYLQKIDGVDYNTDWVTLNLSAYAPINSPVFTGDPQAPTPTFGDDDTSIATTAFVQAGLLGGTANARNLEVYVRNQSGSTIPAGSIVYISGATGNRPLITLAQANNDANSAQTMGFTKTSIANNGFGYVIVRGELENIDTSALTEGVQLYLSPTTAGTWTTTKPSAPQHLVYVGIVVRAHPTLGVILVAVQNGYELNELHDVAITSPTNGQVLKYNSSTNLWVNGTDSSGVAWGAITGTLSSQTDLQTALNAKYDASNPAGYITSSALTPYLTSATAASTYQTIAGMSSYLTTSAAASTYYPLTGNPSGFITSSALSPYLTSATAASTYQTLSGMSSYLTTSSAASTYYPLSNPSGYIDASALSGYATESWVTSQGYLTDAPIDGNQYVRLNGAWSALSVPADYITSVSSPLSVTAGDLSIDLTGYATESWVTSQGYLTTAPVTSVAGKTGAVTLVVGDVSGAAPLASPTFTGVPAAPTATAGTSTTQLATTAFVTTADNLKANLASPTFTGTPAAPTATAGTSTTQIATTAFVTTADNLKANLASPTFTGTPSAPTAAADTNTTQLATTAFVVGQAGSATPLVNGTAAVGTSLRYARQDHVHGTDTTRAPLASPTFTGVPAAPTATAGTNTTQIATTAFVTAAIPGFATSAEIQSPSSSTKVITPADAVRMITNAALFTTQSSSPTFSTSGTGAEAYKYTNDRVFWIGTPNVSTAGWGQMIFDTNASSFGVFAAKRGAALNTKDFNKKIYMSGTMCFQNMGDANTVCRLMLGGRNSATSGNPTMESIGWKVVGGGSNVLTLVTYGWNGSASVVTETASTFTPVAGQSFDWLIYHEPNTATPSLSKAYLYVNDSLVATGIYSPTTATSNYNYYVHTCEATASQATRMTAMVLPTKVWWSKS